MCHPINSQIVGRDVVLERDLYQELSGRELEDLLDAREASALDDLEAQGHGAAYVASVFSSMRTYWILNMITPSRSGSNAMYSYIFHQRGLEYDELEELLQRDLLDARDISDILESRDLFSLGQ